VPRLV